MISRLDRDVRRLGSPTTAQLRTVRRRLSRELAQPAATDVIALAERLVRRDGPFDRFIAYELIAAHPTALAALSGPILRRLGQGMDSWGDVDTFACYVAGPAWREGSITDAEIMRWAQASDRWWRRAGVVSTVALNVRARGGTGDPRRTVMICELAVDDRDPMVVKALSWALRELVVWDPEAVRRFLDTHHEVLAARVTREVRSKLETGRKHPARRAT